MRNASGTFGSLANKGLLGLEQLQDSLFLSFSLFHSIPLLYSTPAYPIQV